MASSPRGGHGAGALCRKKNRRRLLNARGEAYPRLEAATRSYCSHVSQEGRGWMCRARAHGTGPES